MVSIKEKVHDFRQEVRKGVEEVYSSPDLQKKRIIGLILWAVIIGSIILLYSFLF